MPLDKQAVPINFGQGLDLKSDPHQIPIGRFARLKNTIFQKTGLMQKRNGFASLPALPDTSYTFVTTFNGNLTAIGSSLISLSAGAQTWTNRFTLRPASLSVLPVVKSSTNQTQSDAAVSPNGLVCTAFTDIVSGSATYKYVVSDSTTGQNVTGINTIANGSGSPRVFVLGNYFVIVYTATISATAHLQYIAVNINTLTQNAAVDLSTVYTPASTVAFDAVVANNNLYIAWNGSDVGGAIRMTQIDSTLLQHSAVVFTGHSATIVGVTADTSGTSPVIYVGTYNAAETSAYVFAVNQNLGSIFTFTAFQTGLATGGLLNLTLSATAGVCTIFYEVKTAYSYDSGVATNIIDRKTVTQAGSVGTLTTIARSVGLASKAFIVNGVMYMLAVYSSPYQPSYFLIDSSGRIIAKLAYSNASGYLVLGLPGASVYDSTVSIAYLIRDLVEAINKSQGAANAGLGVYAQTGVNVASITIGSSSISTGEIADVLQFTGGFLWMYDGVQPVEQGFFLWPDYVELTGSTTGGLMTAQTYFYQALYEWTDSQGNIHRSAPSIPVSVTTTGSTSSVTVNVPTLRLTYKTVNPPKIVIYRWSTAQQTYFQVTSVAVPLMNSKTSDSVAFVDTQADSAILGNSIIYTTGGVIENISAPSPNAIALYRERLFLIDGEDTNLLWYSKQVIESTPVEMSDLFTLYVAPTAGAQGSTGDLRCLAPMDDKLLLFKRDAIYYMTGAGPDNLGSNNDFSDPIFITATVGCSNQQSIVFIPQGLIFQSDKGLWLLGRDLSTNYIGAPVEDFNQYTVLSAINIPGTNQVRFTLNNGVTLMYDYFFGQWGTFEGIAAVSSTLYQNSHTFINSFGQVLQENSGTFLDGANPVLMGFTTGPLNFTGLQGFERAYWFNLLGTFISPHKLSVSVAYDYSPAASQQTLIVPDNYNGPYGIDPLYGSTYVYGGTTVLEQWRLFFQKQKCQSFTISIDEIFDPTYGTVAGEGLTLSGLNIVVGAKGNYPRLPASRSTG